MQIKYNYKSGALTPDIKEDVTQLLTDAATTTTQLSNSCNKTLTEITRERPAEWRILDDDFGNQEVVLAAPHQKNANLDKIIWLQFQNNRIVYQIYLDWDTITHSGTVASGHSSSSIYQPLNLNIGGQIVICADQRYLIIASNVNGKWGDNNYGGLTMLVEYTSPETPWDDIQVPNYALINSGQAMAINSNAAWVAQIYTNDKIWMHGIPVFMHSNGWILDNTPPSNKIPSGPNAKVPNLAGQTFTPLNYLYIGCTESHMGLGDITAGSGLYIPPNGLEGHQHIIEKTSSDGSATQKFWVLNMVGHNPANSGKRLAIPYG